VYGRTITSAALIDYFHYNAPAIANRVEQIARMHDRALIATMIQDVRSGEPCVEAAYVPPAPSLAATGGERR
jgi:hypothetical protein